MKVMWCSDWVGMPTGYAQVTRNILYRLKLGGHNVSHASFHLPHPSMPPVSAIPVNYPIHYPINFREFYGNAGSIEHHTAKEKPDLLCFLGDHFMFKWFFDEKIITHDNKKYIIRKIDEIKKNVKKMLYYFPFDSDTVYSGAKDVLELMDMRVAMCRWGQKILKEQTGLESFVIPHGVDTNTFRPLGEAIKDKLKKDQKWEGRFVVGSVARNQSRKLLGVTLRAFAKFAEDKDDAILFLHCDPKDPQGNDLTDLAKRLGIEKKIHYGMQRFDIGLPDQNVNLAYNVMDIHVLASTGEGFGLPLIEAMSVGVPNIATKYTSMIELLRGRGELVKIAGYIPGQYNTNRALASEDDLAAKMTKLYKNPKLRERYKERGRKFILKHFTWDKISRMWLDLIEKGEIEEEYCADKDVEGH